jgi:MFS family permease
MRIFYSFYSWWGMFIAFCTWFAITPLLPEIQKDLNLTKHDIWTSSIAGVGGTVLARYTLGPLCDKYGPRVLYAIVLCLGAIPGACLGLVNSAQGLIIMRLFSGMVGSVFVMCEYWCSLMFTKEIVGTANAFAAGWGNLGKFADVINSYGEQYKPTLIVFLVSRGRTYKPRYGLDALSSLYRLFRRRYGNGLADLFDSASLFLFREWYRYLLNER